jgi:hypothetical protein
MMFAFSRRAATACLAMGLLAAAASAAPSFRSDKNYPNLGLKIRVLGNSQPEPLAQFKTYTYTFTQGGESTKRDLYDPRELWYATQHAGQWRDEDGNVMILGKPTALFPEVPKTAGEHVAREDFDKAVADPASAFDPASAESLTTWIAAFAGGTPKTPEPLRTLPFGLASAVFFPIDESATLAYAFRVKTRKPSGQTAPSDWFVAVVKIADNTPKTKVRKDFETQFLANVAAVPQTGATAAGGVQPKSLTAPANGKTPAVAIPDHPSRTAARKSIANMKDWWFAETPEYIFLSNIRSATGKNLVKELQGAMPVLRGAFAKLIPPFDTSTDVSVVRIFEEPQAYKQYVGKEIEWSVGVWISMRRELVILSQGRNQEQTLEIIKHEGFHQYLFYAASMIENSMWFNEGHACFFEVADIDTKGRVEIPENRRVGSLLDNLDTVAGLIPKILHAGHAAFYSGTDQQRNMNYTTAWALVYFLRKGAPAEKLTAYGGIIDTYLRKLAETKDCDAATTAAFEGVDMATFQGDFVDFWKKGRNAAKRYDPLAEKKTN